MAVKKPVKAIYSAGNVTGLEEFATGDQIDCPLDISADVHENYGTFTLPDYPATNLNTVEGTADVPSTSLYSQSYFERHTAATGGDSTKNYDMSKWTCFYESGHAQHSAVGRFEFRDRSGVNTKDRMGVFIGGGASATNSGRGLFGAWINLFDNAGSDLPSLCGIEINIDTNRTGLDSDPWGGYGVSRSGILCVGSGLHKGHAAFITDALSSGTNNWQYGLALRKTDLGMFMYTVTDTDISGIILAKNSGNTKAVFSISNTGEIRTDKNLSLQINTSNTGAIYFGSDGNDYIVFDGSHFMFYIAGAKVGQFPT
jgi:hypothetical protein